MKQPPIKTRWVGASTPEQALGWRAWDELYRRAAERLAERMKAHDVPEPSSYPVQDMVLAYRMPNEYQDKDEGGLIVVPDVFWDADGTRHEVSRQLDSPLSVGLLIYAGLEAMAVLESHGVMPGDYVQFARYAGEEESKARVDLAIETWTKDGMTESQVANRAKAMRDAEMSKKKLIRFQAPHIHQSLDLQGRLCDDKPTMRIVREQSAKGVLHIIEPVTENLL